MSEHQHEHDTQPSFLPKAACQPRNKKRTHVDADADEHARLELGNVSTLTVLGR